MPPQRSRSTRSCTRNCPGRRRSPSCPISPRSGSTPPPCSGTDSSPAPGIDHLPDLRRYLEADAIRLDKLPDESPPRRTARLADPRHHPTLGHTRGRSCPHADVPNPTRGRSTGSSRSSGSACRPDPGDEADGLRQAHPHGDRRPRLDPRRQCCGVHFRVRHRVHVRRRSRCAHSLVRPRRASRCHHRAWCAARPCCPRGHSAELLPLISGRPMPRSRNLGASASARRRPGATPPTQGPCAGRVQVKAMKRPVPISARAPDLALHAP